MSALLAAGTGAAAVRPGVWDRIAATVDGGDVATVLAALLGVLGAMGAAAIAAVVAVKAYKGQQKESRRQQRATFYAEAVRAVEDYLEAPYRIRRRDGSTAARRELTQHVSDVKSRISVYTAWMAIHGTDAVASGYDAFVLAAQSEAGQQMTAAWHSRPTKKDRDVPIGSPLPRASSDAARATVLTAMEADLDR
ncbi:hypothetical protein E4P39_01920 [Blastococcus sp. CT_GayMR19]|uniref:hypothetical protein n=1 Tax=Blastococcus sp. CT_GayMR19 TaxID=2559608 RepID=UPI001073DFCD|nr:hypothetical protein [Blastococcus sp. CT_GayMR19]TFV79416.1 hypothetical protein E4P39_01920 [Blastococcus sp. CT_GayMR19]